VLFSRKKSSDPAGERGLSRSQDVGRKTATGQEKTREELRMETTRGGDRAEETQRREGFEDGGGAKGTTQTGEGGKERSPKRKPRTRGTRDTNMQERVG